MRVQAVCQVRLVVAHCESRMRLLGSLFLAVAKVQNRLVDCVVEGKLKPASFLPSDGRADGKSPDGQY